MLITHGEGEEEPDEGKFPSIINTVYKSNLALNHRAERNHPKTG